jgi:hypothetical protein
MFVRVFVELILPTTNFRKKVGVFDPLTKGYRNGFRFFANFAIRDKGFLTLFIFNYQLPKNGGQSGLEPFIP